MLMRARTHGSKGCAAGPPTYSGQLASGMDCSLCHTGTTHTHTHTHTHTQEHHRTSCLTHSKNASGGSFARAQPGTDAAQIRHHVDRSVCVTVTATPGQVEGSLATTRTRESKSFKIKQSYATIASAHVGVGSYSVPFAFTSAFDSTRNLHCSTLHLEEASWRSPFTTRAIRQT